MYYELSINRLMAVLYSMDMYMYVRMCIISPTCVGREL